MNQPDSLPVPADSPPQPSHPVVVQLAQVQPVALQWLWPQRVPLGKLTLLIGPADAGKSLLAIDLAARVSAGLPWPDCPKSPNQPAGVVILSAQDDLADTVLPRFE